MFLSRTRDFDLILAICRGRYLRHSLKLWLGGRLTPCAPLFAKVLVSLLCVGLVKAVVSMAAFKSVILDVTGAIIFLAVSGAGDAVARGVGVGDPFNACAAA